MAEGFDITAAMNSGTRSPSASPDAAPAIPAAGLSWAIVFAFAGLLVVLGLYPSYARYEPRFLLPTLNGIFTTLVFVLVSLLVAHTYLAGGSGGLLPMGAGLLITSLASLLSGLAVTSGHIDTGVTIYNIGLCPTALGQLTGMLWLLRDPPVAPGRRRWSSLVFSYLLAMALIGAAAIYAKAIPPFFIPGQGTTPLRKIVLGSAIVQFAVASVLMLVRNRRRRSGFLHWYGLGLMLLALGLWGVGMAPVIGSPVNWAGRAAQYAGGIYLLVAVLVTVRQNKSWTLPLDLLRETQQRYQSLVEYCPDPILVHAHGRYVFANPAAARLLGADSPEQLVGRDVMSMVHPDERTAITQRIQQSYQGQAYTPLRDTKILRLDGQPVEVEATGARVRPARRAGGSPRHHPSQAG